MTYFWALTLIGVQADCTMNNKYFYKTLTNLDEFSNFKKLYDSTIVNNFQFNKYVSLI